MSQCWYVTPALHIWQLARMLHTARAQTRTKSLYTRLTACDCESHEAYVSLHMAGCDTDFSCVR